jgi:trimethylamine--corrinoid protein Co-methyltransferase
MSRQYLKLLSKDDLEKIHHASLKILENTGMLIDHDKACAMLQEAGARVDPEKKIVRFPPDLVEKSLQSIPKNLNHAGRNPENDAIIEDGDGFFSRTAGGAPNYIDLKSGEYRRAKISDLKEFATLVDALPNIHACGTMHVGDVPAQTADIHCMQVLLESQRKNIVHNAFTAENLKYMIEMMLAVRGSREKLKERPLVHTIIAVLSPLFLPGDDVDQLLLAGEYGIPTGIVIMPSVGGTAPITLAGILAQGNAELLGTMTLSQVAHPGHPIPYFWDPCVTEMKTGASLVGAPENALLCAAIGQLGREFYDLPCEGVGLLTDGGICEQTLFQKASNSLMQSMAGGNLVIGAGLIDSVMAASPVQLVIDDEIMGILHRILRGIEINEETLALDVIDRVGPKSEFLTDEHTLRHLRAGELFNPEVFDRNSRDTWISEGAKGIEQRAREKALTIMEKHEVEAFPEHVTKELKAIVGKANRELVKKHKV